VDASSGDKNLSANITWFSPCHDLSRTRTDAQHHKGRPDGTRVARSLTITISFWKVYMANTFHQERSPSKKSGDRHGCVALAGISACLVASWSQSAYATQTESPREPIPLSVASPPPSTISPGFASSAPPETTATSPKTVMASYQGSETAGQPTASGEPYNPNDLTAASRNLPMGSIVMVTNPDTGRSVKVRINDRGPFVHGRSLDLSKRAAEKIGITHKGVTRVKVRRLIRRQSRVNPNRLQLRRQQRRIN
jgi:rare lipoprotein A